jgi:hypothetical protein
MLLRLSLVGMVAALGVTLPSQAHSDKWLESAQTWANSVFAEWDTWQPPESFRSGCFFDSGDAAECPACRLARTRLAANERKSPAPDSDAKKPVTFEPIMVDEHAVSGIAYELNNMFDGQKPTLSDSAQEIVTEKVAKPGPHGAVVKSFPEREAGATVGPTGPFGVGIELELGFVSALRSWAAGVSSAAGPVQPSVAAEAELDQTGDDQWLCGENPDDDWALSAEPSGDRGPAAGTVQMAVTAPKTPEPCADFDEEFAFEIAQSAPPVPPTRLAAALRGLPRDVFAPSRTTKQEEPPGEGAARGGGIVLADLPADVFAWRNSGAAGELPGTRVEAADGSSQVTGPAPRPSAIGSTGQPRFGHAIELTRQALFEWMNVLTGPAILDMSAR